MAYPRALLALAQSARSSNFTRIWPTVILILFAIFLPGYLPVGQFSITGDSLVTAAQFKTVIQGSIFGSAQMGWPVGMYAPQFPFADLLSLLLAKLCSIFVRDAVRLYLLMIHLALFLNTACSYWCLRSFACSRMVSLICSFVFGASFFFFVRSTVHLFFAMYLAVPLGALLVGGILGRVKISYATIVICGLAVALSHVYYAVATLSVTILALAIAMMAEKTIVNCRKLTAVASIIVPLGLVNGALYWIVWANGMHLPVRSAEEQPALALRFVDAFIPTISATKKLLTLYYTQVRPLGEGYEYIGYLASVGLLIALLSLMRRVSPVPSKPTGAIDDSSLPFFAVCALVLVVVCLPFGAGLLINLIFPFIRAQNRFSIFLSFWGLLSFAIFFTKLPRGWLKAICFAILIGLGSIELWERVNFLSRGHCPSVCAYDHPCNCYEEVKRTLEPIISAMKSRQIKTVFQLPFQKFPESGPLGKRQDYSGFFPYLAIENNSPLRFSYGLTDDDLLGDYLAASQVALRSGDNVARTLDQVACVGYQGILVDKVAYSNDDLTAVQKSLSNLHREIDTDSYSLYNLVNTSPVLLSASRSERIQQSVHCFTHQ